MAYENHIDDEKCKGCGLCVTICPKNVLEISEQVNTKTFLGHMVTHKPQPLHFSSSI